MSGLSEYLAFLQRHHLLSDYIPPSFTTVADDEYCGNINFALLVSHLSRLSSATWFVHGPGGSGKTSLIWHLMFALLEQDIACVRISAESLRIYGTCQRFPELVEALCPLQVEEDLWSTRCKPKHGKIVLLVDGISEIEQEFYTTAQWPLILEILAGNHRFPVLATSRHFMQDLPENERDIFPLSLRPLELSQIQSYLQTRGLDADNTLYEIEAVKMEGATANPFLLSLLANFSLASQGTQDKSINWPRSRAELLGKTFERAQKTHSMKQREHIERSGLTDKALLCAMALALHVLQENTVRLVDLETLLKQVWPDEESGWMKPLVHAFLEMHLVECDDEKNGYRFVHDSLVEYGLALGAYAQQSDDPPTFACASGQFDAVLGDWVGLHPNPKTAAESVLQQCRSFECPEKLIDVAFANRGILDAETLEILWQAVGKGLLANRRIKTRVADALGTLPRRLAVEALRYKVLRPLKQANNTWMANQVEKVLLEGKLTGNRLVKLRRDAHGHLNPPRRPTAYAKASQPCPVEPDGDLADLRGQFEQLLQTPDSEIELRNVLMLAAKPGFWAAVPWLRDILLYDTYDSVRNAAVTALGWIGDRGAAPALNEMLTDSDPINRGAAATALGRIGDHGATPALGEMLKTDSDLINRGAAATALGRIGDSGAVPTLCVALKTDSDSGVRGSAAMALGQIGDRGAVPLLCEALKTDSDSAVRGSVANALGQIGDLGAVAALSEALLDKNAREDIRGSAANALGQIGDRSTVPALSEALLNKNVRDDIRRSAAVALARIGDRGAVPALCETLKMESHSYVREAVANALGQIGGRSAVSALSEVLLNTDSDSNVRDSAANALGQIGDLGAVAALSEALLDKNACKNIRHSAANALGQIGDRSAVPALSEALKTDSYFYVQSSVVLALQNIRDTKVLPLLSESLNSQKYSNKLRALLVGAYCHIDGKLEPWVLDLVKKNNNKWLRGKITELVAQYASRAEEFTWLSRQARYDWDYVCRTNAVRGLARAGQLDDEVVRYLIDPALTRHNGRRRDTDSGVCGSVAAAIVQNWASSSPPPKEHRRLVVELLADPADNHPSIIYSGLGPLDFMPLENAALVLQEMKTLLPSKAHAVFVHELERRETTLQYRRQQEAAIRQLRDNPAKMLQAFQQQAQSHLKIIPPPPKMFDCALITVTNTESKTLLDTLKARSDVSLPDHPASDFGRSYWPFTLQGNSKRPLSCLQIQPSDKGAPASQALVSVLIQHFQPRLIVMVGVCGGFPERGVRLNDVIMALQVHGYERQRLLSAGNQGQPQVYRFSAEPLNLARALYSGGLLEEALGDGKFHVKDYAAGEKVIADIDTPLRKRILNLSDDIYGVEMEGHGFSHAVWENTNLGSVKTALIKGVSDLCDGEMREDKDEKQRVAATRATQVALVLITHFLASE
ncbi:MAG: HEAT repeat domain-containing protein [Methylococcaceae bacterium]|jgi:HEAT repeat protein/nucleoside phosphorylase